MTKKIVLPLDKEMFDQLFEIATREQRSVAFVICDAAAIFLDRVSATRLRSVNKRSRPQKPKKTRTTESKHNCTPKTVTQQNDH